MRNGNESNPQVPELAYKWLTNNLLESERPELVDEIPMPNDFESYFDDIKYQESYCKSKSR